VLKHQDNSSLVIVFPILMSCLCLKALTRWGEIWCWSPFGLKGLNTYIFYEAKLAAFLKRNDMRIITSPKPFSDLHQESQRRDLLRWVRENYSNYSKQSMQLWATCSSCSGWFELRHLWNNNDFWGATEVLRMYSKRFTKLASRELKTNTGIRGAIEVFRRPSENFLSLPQITRTFN